MQNAIFTVLLCGWLGGLTSDGKPGPVARLLTLEEVGEIFKGTEFLPYISGVAGTHSAFFVVLS